MASISHTMPSPASDMRDDGTRIVVMVAVAAWFATVFFAGRAGLFEAGPSRPPLPLLVAILIPPALFALGYRLSDRLRNFALSLDLRVLTAMQAWRVIGIMFLALYAFDLLPGVFAWPAGLGDVAVGIGAVIVLKGMMAQRRAWERRVFWLNVAGLADFVAAIATGVLSSNSALGVLAGTGPAASMGLLPLSLVPTFAVPLWIVLHMIALIQLRRMREG
jgi:hypothetical protein